MERFLKEALIFQNEIGINTSFDFTTGRDFFDKNRQHNQSNQKKTDLTIEQKDALKTDSIKLEQNKKSDINNKQLLNVYKFEELIEKIKNFDGCDLKKHSINTVIFDGNQKAKIMLIGEAPGENEDVQGKPFCGQSGQLLRQALDCINLNINNLLITNTVYWRPPQNRKPTEEEIEICKPFLMKTIEIVNPEIIILCGATAITSILKTNQRMSEIAGKVQTIDIDVDEYFAKKIKVFPIYHPSFLLRQPSMKKTFWHHLLLLQSELEKMNFYAV